MHEPPGLRRTVSPARTTVLTEPPRSGYSLTPFSTRLNLPLVLARTVGIFGCHLTFSSGLAWTVLTVEAAGVVMLLLTAALLWQRR